MVRGFTVGWRPLAVIPLLAIVALGASFRPASAEDAVEPPFRACMVDRCILLLSGAGDEASAPSALPQVASVQRPRARPEARPVVARSKPAVVQPLREVAVLRPVRDRRERVIEVALMTGMFQ